MQNLNKYILTIAFITMINAFITTKFMKKHKEIDNPYALAWYMKNKGHKSHYTSDGKKK